MSINFEIKKKITIDGKDYNSLAEVPPEVRASILKTMASNGANTKTTIHINGKTYSSLEDLPVPLRAVVGGLTTFALNRAGGEAGETPNADGPFESGSAVVRPEPVLSMKTIAVAIGLAALLLLLLRLVL